MKTSCMFQPRSCLRATACLVVAFTAVSLHAADYTWTGDGGNRSWDTTANWNANPSFTTSNNFIFSTAKGTTLAAPSFIVATKSVGALTFATSSDIGIRLSSSATSNTARTLIVKDAVTVRAGANGNYTIGVDNLGVFRLASAASTVVFNHNGSGLLTVATTIDDLASGVSSAKSIEKTGSGTLVFTGANAYTGNTTVSAGTLNLTSTSQMRFVLGNGNIGNRIAGSGTVNFDGMLLLDSSVLTDASGTWNLIDVDSLNASFNAASFGLAFVDGPTFTNVSSGIYTSGDWTFNSNTGNLTLGAIPEPATFALFGAGAVMALVLAVRRRLHK